MTYVKWTALVLLGSVVVGCESPAPEPEDRIDTHAANRLMYEAIRDAAIKNAVIRQHTLYPYHFVQDSAQLNPLGLKELGVLISHCRENPGKFNVRRGGASDELYRSRLESVMLAMADAGVEMGNVRVSDGLPGGDGMPADQVLKVTRGRNSPSQPLYYENGGSSQGGGINLGVRVGD